MVAFNNKWVLITGASSGLGMVFAEKLAAAGAKLVLVARSENVLNNLAQRLKQDYQTESVVIVKDLSENKAAQSLFSTLTDAAISIDILINNAGYGIYGHLHTTDLDRVEKMIMLNITTLTALTHLFLPEMIAKKSGVVINVSSVASFVPIPNFSTYSATKAYVRLFTEVLWNEYKKEGIQFLCVCPGSTDTQFFKNANMRPSQPILADPKKVVDQALAALDKNKMTVVCGPFSNKVLAQLRRFVTRKLLAKIIIAKLKKAKR